MAEDRRTGAKLGVLNDTGGADGLSRQKGEQLGVVHLLRRDERTEYPGGDLYALSLGVGGLCFLGHCLIVIFKIVHFALQLAQFRGDGTISVGSGSAKCNYILCHI